MRRLLVIAAAGLATTIVAPAAAATSSSVAALQVALRAHGHYRAAVDGVDGPLTRSGLTSFQKRTGLPASGRVGRSTRSALGPLGVPLLGQRELGVGAIGWDVSSLEFKLVPFGLRPEWVDGRFTVETAKALVRLQSQRGLPADGIAGKQTFRTLNMPGAGTFSPPVRRVHTVLEGESFFSVAERYGISPLLLAKESGLSLSSVIVPGQKLAVPAGARVPTNEGGARAHGPSASAVAAAPSGVSSAVVRTSIDRWSSAYGVDPRLARATAWMESGFQPDVVSSVGAVGVMQLLPGTWQWVDRYLLGTTTPRTYDGNIRAGVRYLRWLLDQFNGDRRLALAGYYQGAQAVRDRGLYDDTKQYVTLILKLFGTV